MKLLVISQTMFNRLKKKTINSNTNYHKEIKFIPINMDYSLLQFDAFNFFLGVSLRGKSLPILNFSNLNSQI